MSNTLEQSDSSTRSSRATGVLKVLDIKAGEQRFEIRKPAYVVGVDVLQAERGRRPDADEHRVMDLEQVEIESTEYDVVLCINVLEHARDPLALFPVIREGLKPEGVFVIELPNVVSLKGFLVRLTPWSVHRWFYARVLRVEPGDHPAPVSPLAQPAPVISAGACPFGRLEGPVLPNVRRPCPEVGPPPNRNRGLALEARRRPDPGHDPWASDG